MTDLDALIAKLEAATEGSRELDQAIVNFATGPNGWLIGNEGYSLGVPAPPDGEWEFLYFTRSLDAAMTLIGDDWSIRLSAWDDGKLGAHAWLFAPSSPVMSDVKCWGEAHIGWPDCHSYKEAHRHFARALCIAALKSRIQSNG